MKILQMANYYYPHIGGIEQVARDCSNSLKDTNEVKVICFNHENGDKIDTVDNVEVIRAGCFAKIASQSLSFSYYKNLKKVFKNFAPDLVIFHYPNPFAAHYLLKILKRYPNCKLIIYWHLDIYKQKLLKKLFYTQNKQLCKKAKLVLGATPAHLKDSAFYKYFKDKCTELPYGVNLSNFVLNDCVLDKVKNIKEENVNKIICFAMGRLVPYKGMEYLIKAAKLLNDSFSIYIAGDGPLKEELILMAKNCNNVRLLGSIGNEEAMAYRLSCDIFCFPSITRNECFGLALAEAMYFEKPAITFTIPHSGVNYVSINGETGIEVENSNIIKYAEAIKLLAKNKDLRLQYGQAAKQRVVNNFTFEHFKTNLLNLMEIIK